MHVYNWKVIISKEYKRVNKNKKSVYAGMPVCQYVYVMCLSFSLCVFLKKIS